MGTSTPSELIPSIRTYVSKQMSLNDPSHDIHHINRVLGLSYKIYSLLPSTDQATLDLDIITLCALLHDIGDRKYIMAGTDPLTQVQNILLEMGADAALAEKIQIICSAVSYSTEIQDLEKVQEFIKKYPELAVVQDADRIDSIGAVGIGRFFIYGALKTERGMDVGIIEEKLVKIEGLMKTAPGRRIAMERTRRLKVWREWWDEEVGSEDVGLEVLDSRKRDREEAK